MGQFSETTVHRKKHFPETTVHCNCYFQQATVVSENCRVGNGKLCFRGIFFSVICLFGELGVRFQGNVDSANSRLREIVVSDNCHIRGIAFFGNCLFNELTLAGNLCAPLFLKFTDTEKPFKCHSPSDVDTCKEAVL